MMNKLSLIQKSMNRSFIDAGKKENPGTFVLRTLPAFKMTPLRFQKKMAFSPSAGSVLSTTMTSSPSSSARCHSCQAYRSTLSSG